MNFIWIEPSTSCYCATFGCVSGTTVFTSTLTSQMIDTGWPKSRWNGLKAGTGNEEMKKWNEEICVAFGRPGWLVYGISLLSHPVQADPTLLSWVGLCKTIKWMPSYETTKVCAKQLLENGQSDPCDMIWSQHIPTPHDISRLLHSQLTSK